MIFSKLINYIILKKYKNVLILLLWFFLKLRDLINYVMFYIDLNNLIKLKLKLFFIIFLKKNNSNSKILIKKKLIIK